jgi:DNA polymerase III subunit gamma/tau
MTDNQNNKGLSSPDIGMDESDFQTLYRRFRPQRFADLKGQDHVATALRNAVKSGRIAHAYLFSGPRGTGKTSTARILAKALNCTAMIDGEPCCTCGSCTEIKKGISLDVYELDAASNNGVDAMRELVSRAALGSPGRWKVYIIDEVHMLSTAASNALLKTLEEPPNHVIFVLATTDPQKILPTIRSRTQHFEFHLISNRNLKELLDQVNQTAELGLQPNDLEVVLRKAKGSARDALSALDLISVAGSVLDDEPQIELLITAVAEQDSKQVLVVLEQLFEYGHDAQDISQEIIEFLREGFIASVNPDRKTEGSGDSDLSKEMVNKLGLPLSVRAIELLGKTLVEMKDAPDPRITLEVAILRLTNPVLDESYGALAERLRRLENKFSELTSNLNRVGGMSDMGQSRHIPYGVSSDSAGLSESETEVKARSGQNLTTSNKTIGALLLGSDATKKEIGTENFKSENAVSKESFDKDEPTPGSPEVDLNDIDSINKIWKHILTFVLSKKDQAILSDSKVVESNRQTVTIEVSPKTTLRAVDTTKDTVSKFLIKELKSPVSINFVQNKELCDAENLNVDDDAILPLEVVQSRIPELFPGAVLESEEPPEVQ